MNILQNLAQGLRGAAGVLSPTVQKQTFAQDEREAALKQQMALQMAIKEAEQKRLDAREQALAQAVRGPLEAGDYEGAARAAAVTPGGLQVGLGLLDKADARKQKLLEVQTAIEARNAEARQRHLDRMTEIQQRSQDQLARDRELLAERQRFQAEQAQLARDNQRFMASFAASLRQPPQQQVVQTDQGPMVLGPGGQARPVLGPDGQPVRGVKPTGNDKPLTEFQGKNYLFGTRAAEAHNVLNDLEENISTTGLAVKQSLSGVPIIGGALNAAGNVALSKEQQKVEQAQRNFVNAVLRQESGAVISDAEFANAQKQYFPQPGDSKQVIEQKRQNRLTAILGFEKLSGPGGGDIAALRELGKKPKNDIPPPPPGFKVN